MSVNEKNELLIRRAANVDHESLIHAIAESDNR